jgi:hypothetical protein
VLPLARVQGGRTLSEKELKAAMAEMDRDSETSPIYMSRDCFYIHCQLSRDCFIADSGEIDFDEFYVWWKSFSQASPGACALCMLDWFARARRLLFAFSVASCA